MALNAPDRDTLEEIVKLDGQCLDSKRCQRCPFRAICLPEFLNPIPPSQPQRLKMAQDVLTHHYLIDEDMDIKDHKWDKK
jgi:hypothetical protein